MIISVWLKIATKSLKTANIPSARLDAELILANTLRKNRTYLHAHPDEEIDPRQPDPAPTSIKTFSGVDLPYLPLF